MYCQLHQCIEYPLALWHHIEALFPLNQSDLVLWFIQGMGHNSVGPMFPSMAEEYSGQSDELNFPRAIIAGIPNRPRLPRGIRLAFQQYEDTDSVLRVPDYDEEAFPTNDNRSQPLFVHSADTAPSPSRLFTRKYMSGEFPNKSQAPLTGMDKAIY